MRITAIRATPVNIPLEAPYLWSYGALAGFSKTIVEVETDAGLTGLGEGPSPANVATILNAFAPRLVGRDPIDIQGAEELCLPSWRGVGTTDIDLGAIRAFGAVEMALWDIRGKAWGQPLHALLGGAHRKSIPFTDLEDLTLEVWDKIMAVNLTGPMRLMKAVAPVMKAHGRGRIVNIASVAGLGPTGSSIAYAVSKAGLIHLTRCMAVAMAPETLVNCVAPGLLEGTRATSNLRPEQIERSSSGSLLKKPADKDDCADMVVTMCRTETMTGQTVVIDSGRVFH